MADANQIPILLRKVEEGERMLNCGRSTIYELIDAGKLEMVKLGRATRLTDRSIRRLVDELAAESRAEGADTGKMETAEAASAEQPAAANVEPPRRGKSREKVAEGAS